LLPYGTLSRAIVVGTPSARAIDRATTSPAILEMEYVGSIDLWLSPSAVRSFRGSSSGGS
jgi:hypothetical protein